MHSFRVGKHKKVSRWSSYSLGRPDRSPSLERTFNYSLSLAADSRLPTDSIRIIHENARLCNIIVRCHRSGKRRGKEETETFYFVNFFFFLLSPPFYISFQLTKKVPSFKSETWRDVVIRLFPGILYTSSLSCLCSVTLSQCGTSLQLSSAFDQTRETVASRRTKTIWNHKMPWTLLLNIFSWFSRQVNSQKNLSISLLVTKSDNFSKFLIRVCDCRFAAGDYNKNSL